MRLLVIEKKVARRYETQDPSAGDREASSHRQHGDEEGEDGDPDEGSPLLGSKEEDEKSFKLSPNQPKVKLHFTLLLLMP
jgi:hypothetical protein